MVKAPLAGATELAAPPAAEVRLGTTPPEADEEAREEETGAEEEAGAEEDAAAELDETAVVEVREPETPPLAVEAEAVLVVVMAPGTRPAVEAVAFKQLLEAPAWITVGAP